ncbi:MAG: transporter [Caulobacter sp.]|nr:transporter [Caulobacter sp.]
MRDGGRLSAAIEVLSDIEARHKPARLALKAWGDGARYAGAKDRAFVSGLVLDVLRRKRSLAWLMDAETDRARVLAALRAVWAWPVDRIEAAFGDEPHGPGTLTPDELARLQRIVSPGEPTPVFIAVSPEGQTSVDGRVIDGELDREGLAALLAGPRETLGYPLPDTAPAGVRGDYPDWLDGALIRIFGDDRAAEGQALATRAPVDMRANTLKADTGRVIHALATFNPETNEMLPDAVRIPAPAASERAAPVESSPVFEKGWFEVQDLGSQLAAACAGDIKGRQVLDFCAGGGGKTLALAAAMENKGQLYAYDSEARRLSDTVKRSQRAGVRNLQIRSPLEADPLRELDARMDLVFVDAPCTGSGTWRRHPDTKWRLSPEQLERRIAEQDAVLSQAQAFVKPGGRLVYVTCSLLAEENEDRIAAFLAAHDGWSVRPPALEAVQPYLTPGGFVRLTPRTAATDGFFVALLERPA